MTTPTTFRRTDAPGWPSAPGSAAREGNYSATKSGCGWRAKTKGQRRSTALESTHMSNIRPMSAPQGPTDFICEGIVTFTPAQANAVLNHCTYDRQRRIDPVHVETLSALMKRRLWAAKDKLDFARLAGEMILVNGYHRMSAQAASGVNVEWMIAVHDVANTDELRALYFRFDTNLRTRTLFNIVQGVDFGGTHGVGNVASAALFRASAILGAQMRIGNTKASLDDKVSRRIVDDRLAICETYAPSMVLFEQYVRDAQPAIRKKFYIGGFLAVALATIRFAPVEAEPFWAGLARNDGLRRNDPRAVLLADMVVRSRKGGPLASSLVQPAKAWNAYVEGRSMSIIRVKSGETIPLRRTPFKIET